MQLLSLTHWGRDKMAAIFQTTFSNAFSWMKMYKFRLRFHWNFFPRVQIIIFHHCFRWWLGASQATSHYLKQWWLVDWPMYASLDLNELIINFQAHIKARNAQHSLWNCLLVNATRPRWWLINTGSCNGLVLSGTKPLPEPMLTRIYDTIWCHQATMS